MKRLLDAFFCTLAVFCLLAAIAVLFFASFDQLALTQGVRLRNSGNMFVGLATLLGEPTARLVISTTFVGFAWFLWPRRRKRERSRAKEQA